MQQVRIYEHQAPGNQQCAAALKQATQVVLGTVLLLTLCAGLACW
jgi:hypothetical protein